MTQQRHAYLIGANGPQQTQITPLHYAEQDIGRLEQAFNTYPCKFVRVKSVIANASNTVTEGLEEFAEACQNTDLLVVHFSGHAKSENGELYLIGNNTIFQQDGRLRLSTTIKIRDIKEILDRYKIRQKLLILDCCYSGTALGGGAYRGNEEIEETLEQLKGSTSAILTAGSFREKARELDALNDGQGGGFLSWVVTSACTSRFSEVAREDALSLTDIWNWLENTALHTINGTLSQHEQIPRPRLLNDRVAGIDNEIWFTNNRRASHDDTFTAEQRQREELALLQHEEFLQHFCSGASVEDFDRAKVQEYAESQRDSDQLPMQDIRNLCKRLGLTSGQYTPRRSAVLAFHRMPSRYLHSALVRVTMRGMSTEEPYIRDDIEGSLSEQAEQTIRWLKANLNIISENIGAGQRIDRSEIPERALRELVVNAILHRNYNARESIHVEITSRQVISTNPGRLDSEIEQVEPSFLYQHSHPQNPALLHVLVAQRWAEGRSRGFKIVREEFEKYKLPLPKIHNLPNGLVQVIIQRPDLSTFTQKNEVASDVAQETVEEYPLNVWNVPFYRNVFFTGRDELLQRLHDQLQSGQPTAITQPQAISGLGGIGKTQLATEYAYRYRHEYKAILWVRAESQETLITSYSVLAILLNLPERDAQEQEITIQAVKIWLQTHHNWLLILDNADDLDQISPFLPLPPFSGHILITTRAHDMQSLAQRLDVETLPPQQGALFLLRRANLLLPEASLEQATPDEQRLALQLTHELGGLPLALDQAGAYLEATGMSLQQYQQLYRHRSRDILNQRRSRLADHPEPVATTWSLAFQRVQERSAAAADLLRLCTFLAPDAIPEELPTLGAEALEEPLASMANDPFLFNQAIEALRAYSLLDRDPGTQLLSIHRLVQAVLRDQMDTATEKLWAVRAARVVNAAFPSVKHETWPQCERLLPHALQCAWRIESYDLAFPEAVRLLNQTGLYLLERARYQEAAPLLLSALSISERQLEANHPDVASSLNNLANLYRTQGKYELAEPLLKRALTIREQQLGTEHSGTAASLNNLAGLYYSQGRYELAEPLLERALAIREQQLGTEHPDTALSLNNLAELYLDEGRYESAEPLLERAFAIRERQLGTDHPDTAASLNNLAGLYYYQGKYELAEPLLKRALAIYEHQLGNDHPDTTNSLNNLAALYYYQAKYELAEPLLKRALVIREQQLGLQHISTLRIRKNYAILLKVMGREHEADTLETISLPHHETSLD